MQLFIAWWKYHDPYDSAEGIMGIFDSEAKAVSACRDFCSRENADVNDSACVTVAELNEQQNGVNVYSPIAEFTAHDFPHPEWEAFA